MSSSTFLNNTSYASQSSSKWTIKEERNIFPHPRYYFELENNDSDSQVKLITLNYEFENNSIKETIITAYKLDEILEEKCFEMKSNDPNIRMSITKGVGVAVHIKNDEKELKFLQDFVELLNEFEPLNEYKEKIFSISGKQPLDTIDANKFSLFNYSFVWRLQKENISSDEHFVSYENTQSNPHIKILTMTIKNKLISVNAYALSKRLEENMMAVKERGDFSEKMSITSEVGVSITSGDDKEELKQLKIFLEMIDAIAPLDKIKERLFHLSGIATLEEEKSRLQQR